MKIVKEFRSDDWAKSCSSGYPKAEWAWGLGEDGHLYGKGGISGHIYHDNWYPYSKMRFGIAISEMKKIVKEFGHLVIFT